MATITKNRKAVAGKFDANKAHTLLEAANVVKSITTTKFDASVDIAVRLGVDPKKSNQMVRGTVSLPHGTGRTVRVLVLCTPDKTGTVTMDVGKAVTEKKAGNIDFKVDKAGIVHASIGRVSFDSQKLAENAQELLGTIMKLKPSAAKGTYVKSIYLSSTMSAGVPVDTRSAN